MVLRTDALRVHRSLRKTLLGLLNQQRMEVRFDHDFERVIKACAQTPRGAQAGTWILPPMVQAYVRLHRAGIAHSVETWIDGELAGGLYCINLGAMVFGESMFSRVSDASKMALCALVAFCLEQRIPLIDCQQDTPHLTSLGATLMPRRDFCQHVTEATPHRPPVWQFQNVYWQHLFPDIGVRA
jgi:leucyl/phenylalanyl-tRNA--protein transferase